MKKKLRKHEQSEIWDIMEKKNVFLKALHECFVKHGEDSTINYLITSQRIQMRAVKNGTTAKQEAYIELQAYLDWLKHGECKNRIERKITLHSLTEEEFKELKNLFAEKGIKFTSQAYTLTSKINNAAKKAKRNKHK